MNRKSPAREGAQIFVRPTSRAADAVRHEAEEAAALFPALLIEAERVAHTVAAGLHGRRRAGPGEDFWQHRAYSFGDSVTAIDWRQSARAASRLYVRENEWEAPSALFIWRDPSRSLDYASLPSVPTKRRRADVLAIALTVLLSQAGERIGLLGEDRRPFQGRTAPIRLLEALHIDRFDNAEAPPPAHLPPGARVVIFSDFFTEPARIKNAVKNLAAEGAKGALMQICDPAEEEFPFGGRVEFLDPERRDRLTFGNAEKLRASYQSKFAAHRNALEALSREAGWTFIAHRTDRPAQTALLALFIALADMRIWTT
jgi:uncharacterized protein (DUF58 family)